LADGRTWPSDPSGFFSNGTKPVIEIATREGYRLRLTRDHRVRRVTVRTRATTSWEWVPAGALSRGDEVLIHDHRTAPAWGAQERHADDDAQGYLLGLLIGDGVLKKDKAVLSVWPVARVVNGSDERPGVRGIMERAMAAASRLPHRSDFTGWIEVPGRGEHRLALGALKRLAHDHGMVRGRKAITPPIERRSSAFHCGLLRGLFDSDGSVQGSQQKGVSIRLAQSDLETLRAAQRINY
jgi:ribonucleoside-diphosphate reductase alpha chain